MRASRSPGAFGHARRVAVAAFLALALGLSALVVGQGLSTIGVVRAVEELVLGGLLIAALTSAVAFVAVHLAGWRDPESEDEFEELVRHSEELAREGLVVDPDEAEFMALDPLNDEDFEELVRDALGRPARPLAQRARPRRRSDLRRRPARGAYGLYQGGTVAREDVHDRIVIFRDTLRRDFGHDPELLRDQVTKTVRHELAHHVGFDELGVSRLDL